MFHFRQETVLFWGYHLSKHKMTHMLKFGGPWPPGYAYTPNVSIILVSLAPSKTKIVSFLATRRTFFADKESISKVLNPAAITSLSTREAHLGEECTITATEVFLDVKTLKARRTAASCDQIRFEMLIALNREGVHSMPRMGVKLPDVLGEHWKVCQLRRPSLYTTEGSQEIKH